MDHLKHEDGGSDIDGICKRGCWLSVLVLLVSAVANALLLHRWGACTNGCVIVLKNKLKIYLSLQVACTALMPFILAALNKKALRFPRSNFNVLVASFLLHVGAVLLTLAGYSKWLIAGRMWGMRYWQILEIASIAPFASVICTLRKIKIRSTALTEGGASPGGGRSPAATAAAR